MICSGKNCTSTVAINFSGFKHLCKLFLELILCFSRYPGINLSDMDARTSTFGCDIAQLVAIDSRLKDSTLQQALSNQHRCPVL